MASDCNASSYAEVSLESDPADEDAPEAVDAEAVDVEAADAEAVDADPLDADAVDADSEDSTEDRIAFNELDAAVDELSGFESVKSKSASWS